MADSSVDLAQPAVLSAAAASGARDAADAATLAAFDRYAASLARYVRSFGVSDGEAEDVVQDAFLALFRHLSLGRDATNVAGWLFRVGHNLALKRRRTLGRRPAHGSLDESHTPPPADASASPEAHLIRRERHSRLRRALAALPDRDRRCLLLRAEGLTYRDIAGTVGLSLGGVAKSLARVMTRLLAAAEGKDAVQP